MISRTADSYVRSDPEIAVFENHSYVPVEGPWVILGINLAPI